MALALAVLAVAGCQWAAAGTTDAVLSSANGNEQLANRMAAAAGWDAGEQQCLDALWTRESGFRSDAVNPDSGATGIPQLLPSVHVIPSGWSDPRVQIRWGLRYIRGRYGDPCGAWGHEQSEGWY
jgi:hypothetical protein